MQVRMGQEAQREFNKRVAEKQAKEMREHAINFRKIIQDELVKTTYKNQLTKLQC
jgi:hypothetical protein